MEHLHGYLPYGLCSLEMYDIAVYACAVELPGRIEVSGYICSAVEKVLRSPRDRLHDSNKDSSAGHNHLLNNINRITDTFINYILI